MGQWNPSTSPTSRARNKARPAHPCAGPLSTPAKCFSFLFSLCSVSSLSKCFHCASHLITVTL